MAGSRGIWLQFRAARNRNMLLHAARDRDSSALSGKKILRQWDRPQAPFLTPLCCYTAPHPKQRKTHPRIQIQPEISPCTLQWCRSTAASSLFQDSSGAVLYGIHDRNFGITDEYFMARWTGIESEMLLAVDTIHTITLVPNASLRLLLPLKNVNAKWSEIWSMFPEKEKKSKRGEAGRLSYQ